MDLRTLQQSPAEFRKAILIDAGGLAHRYDDALDDWQRDDCEAIDPALVAVVSDVDPLPSMRFWLERPRGHSKTCDLAVAVSWLLFASRRKLSGVCAAADRDQAQLLRDAIDTLTRLNPWLAEILEVGQWRVANRVTGSELRILTSDAPSSYGLTPDFVVCDEVTHWQKCDLWDSLFSASAKRRKCLLLSIANAGAMTHWSWRLRENIRVDKAWSFRRLSGPMASWITEDQLAEQRRLLPPKVYDRLWLNRWVDGSGDALPRLGDAFSLVGPSHPEPGFVYVGGLDLGLKKDSSAFAVVGVHVGQRHRHEVIRRYDPTIAAMLRQGLLEAPETEWTETISEGTGLLKLVHLERWRPDRNRPLQVSDIAGPVRAAHGVYGLQSLYADYWQSALLCENLRRDGVPAHGLQFTGKLHQELARDVLETFNEGKLALYDHEGLRDDLAKLSIVEKSYGIRLESPKDASGHGDCATALALALNAARKISRNTLNENRSLVFN